MTVVQYIAEGTSIGWHEQEVDINTRFRIEPHLITHQALPFHEL